MKICEIQSGVAIRLRGGLLLTTEGQDEKPGVICKSGSGDHYYLPADTEVSLASDPMEAGVVEYLSEDHALVPVSRRMLRECVRALSEHSGLIQRLESHEYLDARDRRAIAWGMEALSSLRAFLDKEVSGFVV